MSEEHQRPRAASIPDIGATEEWAGRIATLDDGPWREEVIDKVVTTARVATAAITKATRAVDVATEAKADVTTLRGELGSTNEATARHINLAVQAATLELSRHLTKQDTESDARERKLELELARQKRMKLKEWAIFLAALFAGLASLVAALKH